MKRSACSTPRAPCPTSVSPTCIWNPARQPRLRPIFSNDSSKSARRPRRSYRDEEEERHGEESGGGIEEEGVEVADQLRLAVDFGGKCQNALGVVQGEAASAFREAQRFVERRDVLREFGIGGLCGSNSCHDADRDEDRAAEIPEQMKDCGCFGEP